MKLKPITLGLLAVGCMVAQTAPTYTYTVPSNPLDQCMRTLNGCTIHDLYSTDQTITPWGWFAGGAPGTQFDFQQYQGQNPAAGATYFGTTTYNQIPRPDLGPTAVEWTLDYTSIDWTTGSGPYHIVADFITHSYVVSYHCGRQICHETVWSIDSGTVELTPTN